MDLIIASSDGRELSFVDYDFDFDTNDFQITASYASWIPDIEIGCLVYIPGTEIGGIIKNISSATNTGNIYLKGYTWRGYLAKRIIRPPTGSDYYIATGELNDIIRSLVDIPNFVVPQIDTGIHVQYQFERFCSVLDGIEKMLQTVGYRLDIKYIQTQSNGYVRVQAVKVELYGDMIEYSQDSMIDFNTTNDQMGVNHLICLGKGELKDRLVVDLYADQNGNISQSKTISGIDEIVETFENSGAELETLIESGTNRLKEHISKKSFTATIKTTEKDLFIGDVVTGRDYITGNTVTKPIISKVVKRTNGTITRDYKIEGET